MLPNIPARELQQIIDQYQALPFRNGTPASMSSTISLTCKGFIETSNVDNDSRIAIIEGVDFDQDYIDNTVRSTDSYVAMVKNIQSKLEVLVETVVASCKAHRVKESDVWAYLKTLPKK
jgi:ribosomal protein S3AE